MCSYMRLHHPPVQMLDYVGSLSSKPGYTNAGGSTSEGQTGVLNQRKDRKVPCFKGLLLTYINKKNVLWGMRCLCFSDHHLQPSLTGSFQPPSQYTANGFLSRKETLPSLRLIRTCLKISWQPCHERNCVNCPKRIGGMIFTHSYPWAMC